jgi:uncharacterized membrane protein YphA (DoxX/SURF4 family)
MPSIDIRMKTTFALWLGTSPFYLIGLVMLCAAYLQGALTKVFDFGGAVAEMEHFGLHPAPMVAGTVIVFELAASAVVITGFFRWVGALALSVFTLMATCLALRFWEMPAGMPRAMATNAFFEHIGLAGAFLLIAWHDLRDGQRR